jgi:hypothetical protein
MVYILNAPGFNLIERILITVLYFRTFCLCSQKDHFIEQLIGCCTEDNQCLYITKEKIIEDYKQENDNA